MKGGGGVPGGRTPTTSGDDGDLSLCPRNPGRSPGGGTPALYGRPEARHYKKAEFWKKSGRAGGKIAFSLLGNERFSEAGVKLEVNYQL